MLFIEFDNMVAAMTDGAASGSESHGHLIGLLCVDENAVVDRWLVSLRTLMGDDPVVDSGNEEALKIAAQKYVKTVQDGNLEFHLLLPDDDESLADRISAFAHWCQGFLFGLAEAGMQRFDGLPGDCTEILADISELTNVETTGDGEQSERDFFELTEYVKVGTQLIYEELLQLAQAPRTSSH